MNENINKAIEVLNQGGIIIFPTDTAIGIGCRIDDEKAIRKLFDIRRRSHDKAVPVLVDSIDMAQQYLKPVSKEVIDKLINLFWPGALTIILPCKTNRVPELVRGKRETLGVRMPNHPTIFRIIQKIGVPILGPSANFQGEKTPFKFTDLNPDLIKLADYVVKEETENIMKPSTLIDCTKKPWRILREGAIKISNFKNNIVLLIDTSSNKEIKVGLKVKRGKYVLKKKIGLEKAQITLPMVDELLKKHSLNLKDIDEINVNTGPGSFTGLRVGTSIANTLGFFLKIPINKQKIGKLAQPQYK